MYEKGFDQEQRVFIGQSVIVCLSFSVLIKLTIGVGFGRKDEII